MLQSTGMPEMRIEQNETLCTVHMPNEMTIYNAEALRNNVLSALENPQDLHIDLNEVNEIDSAGVQLLIAMAKQCKTQNKTLTLINSSDATSDILKLFGMKDYFEPQDFDNKGDNNES